MFEKDIWKRQADIISGVLEKAPVFDKDYLLPPEEFKQRQKKVLDMLKLEGYDCGIVYSDEHYCGDVPYLAGNNNIIVEPIAAVIAENGLYFIAGLESGIVAEQFCHRSGVKIRKLDIINVDSDNYPDDMLTPAAIVEEACGMKPKKIAMLTTPGIFPLALYNSLAKYVGAENISDISEKYYEIKYEKSDLEMKLIEESCLISDVMLEGMLRILRPGLRETQVAQWGYAIANELGADDLGFKIMVTSGINNRTIVARASNRIIREGDIVHIGVSPKRDGLCGAQRASVMCVKSPDLVTEDYKIWMGFLEAAFRYSVESFQQVAQEGLTGNYHEEAIIEYYKQKAPELEKLTGLKLPQFETLKGYVTTHNSGYTECQEFYGALSCDFKRKCAKQMVMMIDVGLKGYYDAWNDIAIPNLDYIVIEKTAAKFGKNTRILNTLPVNLQYLMGEAF